MNLESIRSYVVYKCNVIFKFDFRMNNSERQKVICLKKIERNVCVFKVEWRRSVGPA